MPYACMYPLFGRTITHKMPPRRFQMPQRTTRRPRNLEDAHKTPPTCFQDAQRRPQDASKTLPKRLQKRFQDGSKTVLLLKTSQDAPMTAPGRPKTLPRRPKTPRRGFERHPKSARRSSPEIKRDSKTLLFIYD